MFTKSDFRSAIKEATENYEDNQLHDQLEETDYSLGVYLQSNGTRRYELSRCTDIDNPVLVTTSRQEVVSYIQTDKE